MQLVIRYREDDALRGAAYGVCDAGRSGQHHPRHMAWHFSPDYISDALAGHSLRNALPSRAARVQANLAMRRRRRGIVRSAALRRDAFSLLNGISMGLRFDPFLSTAMSSEREPKRRSSGGDIRMIGNSWRWGPRRELTKAPTEARPAAYA